VFGPSIVSGFDLAYTVLMFGHAAEPARCPTAAGHGGDPRHRRLRPAPWAGVRQRAARHAYRPADVLPGPDADPVADWLRAHPACASSAGTITARSSTCSSRPAGTLPPIKQCNGPS